MLKRRGFLKAFLFAPAIIPATRLMPLSFIKPKRMLSAQWTMEVPQETISLIGMDVEEELARLLSAEIVRTIDQEFLQLLAIQHRR